MSLYVGNLHPDCNCSILYEKFSLFGQVSSVRVMTDKVTFKSLGYGFINYEKEEDAEKAMTALNNDIVCGWNIRVSWAEKNHNYLKSGNLVLKNLDAKVNELELQDIFSPFGKILSVKVAKNFKGESKNYGFVQFAEEKDADLAASCLTGIDIRGRKILISRFIPPEERQLYQRTTFPNNVYVCNLINISSNDLEKICESYGDVISAKVFQGKRGPKGFGFVSFKDQESAEKAIQNLNRLCLNGERIMATFETKNQAMKKEFECS